MPILHRLSLISLLNSTTSRSGCQSHASNKPPGFAKPELVGCLIRYLADAMPVAAGCGTAEQTIPRQEQFLSVLRGLQSAFRQRCRRQKGAARAATASLRDS